MTTRGDAPLERPNDVLLDPPDSVLTDPPHRHDWIPVGNTGGDSFGPYVYFGCRCGEAVRTQAWETPASRISELVRRVLYDAVDTDEQLNGRPAKLVDSALLGDLLDAYESRDKQ